MTTSPQTIPTIPPSREAAAYLDAVAATDPATPSACAGWTVHEVTAHLAAAAVEVSRHLRAWLAGAPVPATRSFEEREPAWRALPDPVLQRGLVGEEQRVRGVLAEVLARDPGAVIPWTGRQMPVAAFLPHLRSEFALHRWDVVGDDRVSAELLAQPELTAHAVTALGRPLLRRGAAQDPEPGRDLSVRLRSERLDDVRLRVAGGDYRLESVPQAADGDEPVIETDPAARLLMLWGRRPAGPDAARSGLPHAQSSRLAALLAGY